jgi:ADP-ribosylglycohydrolase
MYRAARVPLRVAEFRWNSESGVELEVFDPVYDELARSTLEDGVPLRSEDRVVHREEGPVFMRALLERQSAAYYQFVDESDPAIRPEPTPIHRPAPPKKRGPHPQERLKGCVVAGVVGDALGGAGARAGLHAQAGGSEASVTSLLSGGGVNSGEAQMMLFTLEGMMRAHVARRVGTPADPDPVREIQHAYQRWLHTQGLPWEQVAGPYAYLLPRPDGELITDRRLFAIRTSDPAVAPALSRFAQTHQYSSPEHPATRDKGVGAVVRAGVLGFWPGEPDAVFRAAVRVAALTHGHPSAYLSAGALALIVRHLADFTPLADSVRLAREHLVRWPGHEETLRALDAALEWGARGRVRPDELSRGIGNGSTAEEALAIGVYAALVTDNVEDALVLAVDHRGALDATGAVGGSIAGAIYGNEARPREWINAVELGEVAGSLAWDSMREFFRPPDDLEWLARYPAW